MTAGSNGDKRRLNDLRNRQSRQTTIANAALSLRLWLQRLTTPWFAPAMSLLHLLFILPQLLLHLFDGIVERGHEALGLIVCHKVVLVLGRDLEIHLRIRLV